MIRRPPGRAAGACLVCSQATTPGTATDYEHDDAGNSLGTTADPYGYNDFDQVDEIDGVDQKYRDLGNDIRIATGDTTMVNSSVGVLSRTVGTGLTEQTTYYLYDPEGGILASYPSIDDTGYQAEAVYYATNHQKSVFMLLDADGNRVGWYRYSPYGDPTIVAQTAGAADDNPWRYLSAYYSPENGGYHHLGARMYDNRGHFTQPDPMRGDLGEPLKTLTYGYAAGDPINRSDREGQDWIPDNPWYDRSELLLCGAGVGLFGLSAVGDYATFMTIFTATGWNPFVALSVGLGLLLSAVATTLAADLVTEEC